MKLNFSTSLCLSSIAIQPIHTSKVLKSTQRVSGYDTKVLIAQRESSRCGYACLRYQRIFLCNQCNDGAGKLFLTQTFLAILACGRNTIVHL